MGEGVGRGERKWGKEGGLRRRFEGGFGQAQGSLGRWEGRGRWGMERGRRKRRRKRGRK